MFGNTFRTLGLEFALVSGFVVMYLLICILGLLSVEFGGLWCLIVALMNVGWFLD